MLRTLLLLSTSSAVFAATPVWELVQDARRDGGAPVVLDAADQHRAQEFFHKLLLQAGQNDISGSLRQDALALGLHIRVEEDRVLIWGRSESVGLYVIRRGPARAAILQAPHSFYDLGTGALTSELFERGDWRAAFFNTTHRYGAPGLAPDQRPQSLPDLAHRPFSIFQAATLAATDALHLPTVVQIHGFRSREGESAVLTAGAAQQPSHITTRLQTTLRTLFSEWGPVLNASARPELAGRKNMQGRALSGNGVFVHLELSKTTRDGLLSAPDQLQALHQVLLEVRP